MQLFCLLTEVSFLRTSLTPTGLSNSENSSWGEFSREGGPCWHLKEVPGCISIRFPRETVLRANATPPSVLIESPGTC